VKGKIDRWEIKEAAGGSEEEGGVELIGKWRW